MPAVLGIVDRQVELAQALGVCDHVDLDDSSSFTFFNSLG
jgi:hypothetical protein